MKTINDIRKSTGFYASYRTSAALLNKRRIVQLYNCINCIIVYNIEVGIIIVETFAGILPRILADFFKEV